MLFIFGFVILRLNVFLIQHRQMKCYIVMFCYLKSLIIAKLGSFEENKLGSILIDN